MKTLLLPLLTIAIGTQSFAQTVLTLDSNSLLSAPPTSQMDFDPNHYHFDCRALMLYNVLTQQDTPNKVFEVASYTLLTPIGGAIIKATLLKTKAGSFGGLLYGSSGQASKLFHFINFLHSKVGKPVVTADNFLYDNPLHFSESASYSAQAQKDRESFQEKYRQSVQKFADEFGEEATQTYFKEFQKYHVYSDDVIYQYLYLAAYRLNYAYGPGNLCEFKNNPGKMAQYHLGNARYRVASFKKAKELILAEALAMASADAAAGVTGSATRRLPEPPMNPFGGDWQRWFRTYGPHGRYSYNELR